jgi:hypothetical protein
MPKQTLTQLSHAYLNRKYPEAGFDPMTAMNTIKALAEDLGMSPTDYLKFAKDHDKVENQGPS